jgi:hypothetical protein
MRTVRVILLLSVFTVLATACSQYRAPRTEPPTPSGPVVTQPPGSPGG